MLDLADLAQQIEPRKTVLFLGAGASVPSGAPTAKDLGRYLEECLAHGKKISSNFAELCSLLEQRYSRNALVTAVRERLRDIVPTGGLLALPEFDWHSIYTTNFDRLVEMSYFHAKKPIVPVRSNLDAGKLDSDIGVPLLKLHGCITEDVIDGAHARMVLTETDYELAQQHRELLFRRLDFEMNSKDAIIIGYSLSDPDLSQSLKEAARLHRRSGTPGRLFALIYERDEERAALMEMRGIKVAFGGIDEFFHELTINPSLRQVDIPASSLTYVLPAPLRSATIDVSHAEALAHNAKRLFNGSAASYADIRAELTFERSLESLVMSLLISDRLSVTFVGAAGVGKTTFARRIAYKLRRNGFYAWEHKPEFSLRPKEWLIVANNLATQGWRGVLLIDDSPSHQREVNSILDGLIESGVQSLKLILVGEKSQWAPRTKSPAIFKFGYIQSLSNLDNNELQRLLNLAESGHIRELVEPSFANRSRLARLEHLKQRCHADMFVALKNIFGSEIIDNIILREYAGLTKMQQDVYRTVSGLEVAGVNVHRQFLIRLLGINADHIAGILEVLDGIIEEYDVSREEGFFGWRTRHKVIAEILSSYKLQDASERLSLFRKTVDNMNPTLPLEARSLKDLCVGEKGIRSLPRPADRIELYTKLVELMPWERVPRHRLIREYLDDKDLGAAEHCLRQAFEVVGFDPPLQRYKILLLIARAKYAQGIMLEDKKSLLRQAWELVIEGIERSRSDKYSYLASWEVAKAFVELAEDKSYIEQSLVAMRIGYEKLLDPDLEARLRRLEDEAAWLMAK